MGVAAMGSRSIPDVYAKKTPWNEYHRVGLSSDESDKAPEVCGFSFADLGGEAHVCRQKGLHFCLPEWAKVKQHAAIGMRLVAEDRNSESGYRTVRDTKHLPSQLRCLGKALCFKLWSEDHGRHVRRYRRLDNREPRRNGKSWKIEFITSYFLIGEDNIQIALAAQSMEAADLGIWRAVQTMCRQSLACLSAEVIVPKGDDPIRCRASGSQIVLVPSQGDRLRGLDVPMVAVLDEVIACRDARNWINNAEAAQLSLEEPFLATCTTANRNPESYEFQRFEQLLAVRENPSLEPTTLCELWHLDKDDDWHDRKLWQKANPGLGTIKDRKAMEVLYNKALGIPEDEAAFRLEHLNQIVDETAGVIDADLWEDCGGYSCEQVLERVADCVAVIGGADLSWGSDLTSLALIGKDEFKVLWIWQFSWMHWSKLAKQPPEFLERVQKWSDAGVLKIVRDEAPPTDEFVEFVAGEMADIIEAHLPDGVKTLGFDLAKSPPAARLWHDRGIEHRKVLQGQYLDDAIAAFQDMIRSDQLRHADDPLLTSAVLQSVIERSGSFDRRTIQKNASRKKHGVRVDPLVAVVSAIECLIRPEEEEEMPTWPNTTVITAGEAYEKYHGNKKAEEMDDKAAAARAETERLLRES